jgi:hypothetical protein
MGLAQGELLLERAEARSTPGSLRARFRKQARSGRLPTAMRGRLAVVSMHIYLDRDRVQHLPPQSASSCPACATRRQRTLKG